MEVTITPENFNEYKNGPLPLMVDFWAQWCMPCRALAPTVAELAKEYDGRVVVGKCDIEACEDIAMEYGVRNIPTLLFFKDGEAQKDRVVGNTAKAKIAAKLDALL